ncbi:MAG TPA: hypothetical protein VG733_05065 [Chthoniobacteraceae bacterium]|nr:hypothetical protein [Chthoniobacteraceae bacterium]
MVYDASGNLDREALLANIRAAEAAGGGKRLTQSSFLAHSKMTQVELRKVFPNWRAAMRAAGCRLPSPRQAVETDVLLADWGEVARKLGRVPKFREHLREGRYHADTLVKRFLGWDRVPDCFRKFANGKPQWADVLALLPHPGFRKSPSRFKGRGARNRAAVRGDGRRYGAPLNFKNVRHAPLNEMGVVYLFAMVAGELGFVIESIQSAFPDCEAKRRTGPDTWEVKRIEFEYESRNFRDHGHPAEGCDIIVCWKHNWEDCPKNLEIIALSDEIKRLAVPG